MSIFSSFCGTDNYGPGGTWSDSTWSPVSGGMTKAGPVVTSETALTYVAVWACQRLASSDISRLKPHLMEKISETESRRVQDHPINEILTGWANEETPAATWRGAAQTHLMSDGNTYSLYQRNGRGRPIALWQRPNPEMINPRRNRRTGKIEYVDKSKNPPKVYTRDEVFHIPGFSTNGLVGISPISAARETIAGGQVMEIYSNRFFGSGTHPAGMISLPWEATLSEPAQKTYKDKMRKEVEGLGRAHKILFAMNGEKYTPFTMPAKDAQFLESRENGKVDVCMFYGIPPHMVGIYGRNSNRATMEELTQRYIDSFLLHEAERFDTYYTLLLLTEKERRQGLYIKTKMQALAAGDMKARAEFYGKLWGMGYPLNNILKKEDENPVDGGDTGFIELNRQPAEMAASGEHMKPQFSEGSPGEPGHSKRTWSDSDLQNIHVKMEAMREVRASNKEAAQLAEIDAVVQKHYPGIVQMLNEIVLMEISSIRKKITSYEKRDNGLSDEQRTDEIEFQGYKSEARQNFIEWLDGFYSDHMAWAKIHASDKFTEFQIQISIAANRLLGRDGSTTPALEEFIELVIDRWASVIGETGIGQIDSISRKTKTTPLFFNAVLNRLDEWELTRGQKMAANESIQMSNAAAHETWRIGGVRKLKWVTRGKNCPFCNAMNGKVVKITKNFLEPRTVIYTNPDQGWTDIVVEGKATQSQKPSGAQEGTMALQIYGAKKHPPIHQK